jgi:hypothetical protein
MKIKTSELAGPALRWAVAEAQGSLTHTPAWAEAPTIYLLGRTGMRPFRWEPDIDWSQGGPIIERERLHTYFDPECVWATVPPSPQWVAWHEHGGMGRWNGPTLLIAAMRCYVASKLGDEVDVPDVLLGAQS